MYWALELIIELMMVPSINIKDPLKFKSDNSRAEKDAKS